MDGEALIQSRKMSKSFLIGDNVQPHAEPPPLFPLVKGGGRAIGPPGDWRDGDREIPPHAYGVSAPFDKGVPIPPHAYGVSAP